MKRAASLLVLTLIISSMFASRVTIHTGRTEPTTITVPDDYLSIQEAVNAASSGDTIFVKNGSYGSVTLRKDNLRILGENKESTVAGEFIVAASYTTIENFTLEGHPVTVKIRGHHNLIVNNIFNPAFYSIIVSGSFNVVENCYFITSLYFAIGISDGSQYTILRNNTLIHSFVDVGSSPFTIIENNVFLEIGLTDGISLGPYANGSIIANNTLAGTRHGIAVYKSSDVLLRGNSVTSPYSDYPGIGLYYCDEIQVYGNNLTENIIGLRLMNCSSNLIHHNNFFNNTIQVELLNSSSNIWDNGYPSGGNYWSDYNGSDLFSGVRQDVNGSDGMGDVPFGFDENATDYYPLMESCKFTFLSTDLTGDFWAGIDDIVVCAEAFGSDPFIHNTRWNPLYDVDHDGRVGIEDLLTIAQHFGESI